MERLRFSNEENPDNNEDIDVDHFIDESSTVVDGTEEEAIEDSEDVRHSQYDVLVSMIYDVKERLDRFIELYGNNINSADVLAILARMTSFVDELEPDDELKDFWIDYGKANAAISEIEREINTKNLKFKSESAILEEKRYFNYKRDYKFYIPGFKYIFRVDNHGPTAEHKGLHFALEDKDEVELGVVVTIDEFGSVYMEPHGDKKKGQDFIDNLIQNSNPKDLQTIKDFTIHRFGDKPTDKRRKNSGDSVKIDDNLPQKYEFCYWQK